MRLITSKLKFDDPLAVLEKVQKALNVLNRAVDFDLVQIGASLQKAHLQARSNCLDFRVIESAAEQDRISQSGRILRQTNEPFSVQIIVIIMESIDCRIIWA